jgi:hypothetical protein
LPRCRYRRSGGGRAAPSSAASPARAAATREATPTSECGRGDASWRWLAHFLSVEELQRLLPETAAFPVRRHVFVNLHALNFVIEGLLGEGVASSTRFDPQAKALGEWLRSRIVDIPEVPL